MFTKRIITVSILIILVIGAISWHWYKTSVGRSPAVTDSGNTKDSSGDDKTSSAPVATSSDGNGADDVPKPSAAQGAVPAGMPTLQRPIMFPASFSSEAQQSMRRKMEVSMAALEKDPRNFDEWMRLAILRKTVDDYEGARLIWEFLTKIYPNQPGPYANLAALYAFELKDPARAEENFTKSIAIWSKEVSVYRNAYDFYRYVRKDDTKAKETLTKGIAETNSPDLKYLLDHYPEP